METLSFTSFLEKYTKKLFYFYACVGGLDDLSYNEKLFKIMCWIMNDK